MDEKQKRESRRGVKLRRYTTQEREDALADVPTMGCKGAAAKHGIPAANVIRWATVSGLLATPGEVDTPPAPVVPPPAPVVPPPAPVVSASTGASPPSKTIAPTKSPRVAKKLAAKVSTKTRAKTVARSYTPSERAEILEYAAAESITEAHEKFKVSRFAIYDWQRKVAAATKGEGPSPTSGPGVKSIEAQRDKEILDEWARHPGLGPSQIRNQLRRKGVKVSVHTARVVMEADNHGRTHHALSGLLVPADRYYGRVDEVLARIEAGAGRDVGDGIDLRARSLDLFRVVSRDGVPEVWLMGKKLLEIRP